MRSEFSDIEAGFNKMPLLTAGTAVVVNGAGTALVNTVGRLALAGNFTTTGAFAVVLAASAAVTVTLPAVSGTVATLDGTEILTNKTISGSSNTLTNIGNASLTNSSITINGSSISLGGSATVTAAAGTLTGTTLAANVVTSSLTSVGTLTGGATGAGFTVALATSTVTGALPAANFPALTGDITTVAGALATTLATVATGATTGSSTAIPVVTFNNKGLVTGVTTAAVVAPAGTLSGATLAAGVTASSLTSVGTLSSLTLSGAATSSSYVQVTGTGSGATGAIYANAANGFTIRGVTGSSYDWSLLTQSGASFVARNAAGTNNFEIVGSLIYGGVTTSGITGTGNVVLSASPTLTGTVVLTGTTITGAPTWSSNQAITLSTASQPNITGLGTITSGVWTGTTIAVANGGTGNTGGAFAAYTPTVAAWPGGSFTASGGSAPTVVAHYQQIGKWVTGSIQITMAANIGTATGVSWTLPVSPKYETVTTGLETTTGTVWAARASGGGDGTSFSNNYAGTTTVVASRGYIFQIAYEAA